MGILTYKDNDFYMDGEKYTVRSGAMHYFRIPKEYWHDRLLKLKECGLNTVETYVPWNLHEPKEGQFDFSNNLNIEEYIALANELGLKVILRPGPYICAEWEFGGFPAWLLKYEKMTLRCNDALYMSKVKRYLDALLCRVRKHLASNGGPIIMIQIENEYGSYGNDKDYLRAIAKIYKENEIDCMCFTSDGSCDSMLSGGALEEYLTVVNFGSNPNANFDALKKFKPNQPLMCGEYWCGWFDHWFENHHTRTTEDLCADFENFFKLNASFNYYMFHGGTNFGFMNGANCDEGYAPTVTSYDYCALLNEAGDRTPHYYAVREVIAKYCGKAPALTASETKKKAYGKVELTEVADLFENINEISTPISHPAPTFMEEFGQSYGYILYSSTLQGMRERNTLTIEKVHDRAQIFLDEKLQSTYCRWEMPNEEQKLSLELKSGKSVKLDILVENMGRINYGPELQKEKKGISGVRLGRQYHFGWQIYCLPMEDELDNLKFKKAPKNKITTPTFLRGTLDIKEEPADTFIRLSGFTKGFVKINGFNLGRYFNSAGPQKTLFVPAPILKKGKNEILVFESDCVNDFTVEFFDKPDLG